MDPIAVLQSRIEQLEAKLGFATKSVTEGQQGDSAANNLSATQAVNNVSMGLEKLSEAMPMASELNNYTDPNSVEMSDQNNRHMLEAPAADPVLQHHCQCMHRCKQAIPALESEPMKQVPEMQAAVSQLFGAATEVKADADAVSPGIQEVAQGCGAAAAAAPEPPAGAAQQGPPGEQKLFPRRRNGLD